MLAVLAGLSIIATSALAAPSLTVSTTAAPSILDVDNFIIDVTIANSGDEEIKLLKDPRSVLHTLETDAFNIIGVDGSVPEFTGADVRYSPEAALAAQVPSEWAIIAAGETFTVTHDLAGVYNFTLSGAGAYEITPAATEFYYETAEGTLATIEATIEAVSEVEVTGALSSSRLLRALQKRQSYASCSTSQRTGVDAGVSAGQTLVSSALSDLNNSPSGSSRYVRWFGAYTSSRFSYVKTGFTNLNGKFSGWTYDCSCTESGTYAYVYTSRYGTVYLCTLYFNVANTGPNSKADTLVHEGSHFTQIRGTDDIVYGTSGSLSLASSNPARAVLNADNYAYYSVNA